MDQPLILEFSTLDAATACLDAINAVAATYWAQHGYIVVDTKDGKGVVGKDAANGSDMPAAAMTMTWDNIQPSPDGTFYFNSLSNDPRFTDWRAALAAQGFTAIGTERGLPAEWRDSV